MTLSTRKSIVIGLTTGAITLVFLQRPLLWLSDRILDIFASLFTSHVDRLYESASYGIWPWIDVFVLIIIGAAATGIYIGALTDTWVTNHIRWPDEPGTIVRSLTSQIFARILGGAFLLFFLLFFVLPAFWDLQLNAGFERRITVLAPHIDEQSEEELRALWSTIKSRDDHAQLNEQLEMHASQAEIVLPETLID